MFLNITIIIVCNFLQNHVLKKPVHGRQPIRFLSLKNLHWCFTIRTLSHLTLSLIVWGVTAKTEACSYFCITLRHNFAQSFEFTIAWRCWRRTRAACRFPFNTWTLGQTVIRASRLSNLKQWAWVLRSDICRHPDEKWKPETEQAIHD